MSLKEKLLKVMSEVAVIGKDSRNDEVGYDYVGAALRENRIICLPHIHVIESRENVDGTFAAVELELILNDVDSDETFLITAAGDGRGKNAMGAAQTMAQKYAFKMAFVVAEKGDDPDNDNTTQSDKQKSPTVASNNVWLRK